MTVQKGLWSKTAVHRELEVLVAKNDFFHAKGM